MNAKVKSEIRRVAKSLKDAQAHFEKALASSNWVTDAKKYADKQRRQIDRLSRANVKKVKTFAEEQKKELNRILNRVPGEVQKVRRYVTSQKKDLERLVANVRKAALHQAKAVSRSKRTSKKKARNASSTTAST